MEVSDGSTPQGIQVVLDKGVKGYESMKGAVNTGASVLCHGTVVASPKAGQPVELSLKDGADEIAVLGAVDAAVYPLPNKKLTIQW